jgi:hypothetical protein
MKTTLKLLSATLIATSILSASSLVWAAETAYGSSAAAADSSYTLPEMITCAIQDEYVALAEYNAIIGAFGTQRPFSNIVRAEAIHINELLPLFATYQITVPSNEAASQIAAPASIADSYAAGVVAEQKNIVMYQSFLKENLPADVKAVFTSLLAASEKHLQAFERAASGTSGSGSGQGYGRAAIGNRQSGANCDLSGTAQPSGNGSGMATRNSKGFSTRGMGRA